VKKKPTLLKVGSGLGASASQPASSEYELEEGGGRVRTVNGMVACVIS
jgi:hypothetical protein